MLVAGNPSRSRAKLGLVLLLSCVAASGCAARRNSAPPVQAPLYAQTRTPAAVPVITSSQPRVIIQAPPLADSARATPHDAAATSDQALATPSSATATPPRSAAAPSTFTPRDSPLLAYYDNKPHGQTPKVEPEFAPQTRRSSGWQVSGMPYFGLGFAPYYGYAPGWGGGYGYSPYYGGYYGRSWGLGLGLGLGVGLAARPYYGSYYGGYHGGGYGHGHGGQAVVTGGYAGRVR